MGAISVTVTAQPKWGLSAACVCVFMCACVGWLEIEIFLDMKLYAYYHRSKVFHQERQTVM